MDGVQWIKIKVGIFDGSSFKKIKRAKIGGILFRDKLTAVWFELLDLAGKSNSNGSLMDTNEIPYSSFEDIAIMLDREENEIKLCMQFFISEKMIEIIDNIYYLSNWCKYQNSDKLEKIRENNRLRQAKWRENQKIIMLEAPNEENNVTNNVMRNVTDNVTVTPPSFENKSKNKEKEIYKEKEKDNFSKNSNEFFISISNIVDSIKKIYQEKGYRTRFARTNTTKRLKTILTSPKRDKRLYPLQIILAYNQYLSEKSQDGIEEQFIKLSDSFLTTTVYDYAEKTNSLFKAKMLEKYGEGWEKIKFTFGE